LAFGPIFPYTFIFIQCGKTAIHFIQKNMATDKETLAALKARAVRLGHQIDIDTRGYCLWQVLPGIGRILILGRESGATLDAIGSKLDELTADRERARGKKRL
jgi:hypothetical protein